MRFLSEKNDVGFELAFSAMAAYPTLQQASEFLKEHHDITVSTSKLATVQRMYPDRYESAREKLKPLQEKALTNNLLDNAGLASNATRTAIERTQERLDRGAVIDPSKVARDLADVVAKSVDKRLAMEGRPTKVVEVRDTKEILRALEAMHVVRRVDAEATVEGITDGDTG